MNIKTFYEENPYPNHEKYINYFKLGIKFSLYNEKYINCENILVIGSGTIEANLIAHNARNSNVIGIDISKRSIEISNKNKEFFDNDNLELISSDMRSFNTDRKFDCVIASGVLHHIKGINKSLDKIVSLMSDESMFLGMIYNKVGRKGIKKTVSFFRNAKMDNSEVKKYIQSNSKKFDFWYSKYDFSDEVDLIDTWRNPSFREYTKEDARTFLSTRFDVIDLVETDNRTKIIFHCERG